jgi:hypothetical protein
VCVLGPFLLLDGGRLPGWIAGEPQCIFGRMEKTITLTVVAVITVFLAVYGISVWKSPARRKKNPPA